jgi:hypothetical protein
MKTLVQGRAVVDLLSNSREITNGNRVYPCFPAPTHEIRRHDVKQMVHLLGILSIHLAEQPALARVVYCWRFDFGPDFLPVPGDISAVPSSNTAVIAWVSPKFTATLRYPWGFFASTSTTRWASSPSFAS